MRNGRDDILKVMYRGLFTTLLMGGVLAVHAQQAPASTGADAGGGEAAVRQRVEKFYGLQVEGKFRQSEAFVCEDSKDAFYTARKRQWLSVEIVSAQYDASRNLYMMTTTLGMNQGTPAGIVKVTYPNTTLWRFEDGNWCMHLPPPTPDGKATPFGAMKVQDPSSAEGKKLEMKPVSAEMVQGGVKADKEQLVVAPTGTSSDELHITNHLSGMVELEIIPLYTPGLKLTLSTTELKARETATLKVEFTPVDNRALRTLSTSVMVHPLGIKLPVRIAFEPKAAATK